MINHKKSKWTLNIDEVHRILGIYKRDLPFPDEKDIPNNWLKMHGKPMRRNLLKRSFEVIKAEPIGKGNRLKDFLYAYKMTIENNDFESVDIVVLGKYNFSECISELSYIKTENSLRFYVGKHGLHQAFGSIEALKKFLPAQCIWLN